MKHAYDTRSHKYAQQFGAKQNRNRIQFPLRTIRTPTDHILTALFKTRE